MTPTREKHLALGLCRECSTKRDKPELQLCEKCRSADRKRKSRQRASRVPPEITKLANSILQSIAS